MAPRLAGLGYPAVSTPREQGYEVAQHQAWRDGPTGKGKGCVLLAGQNSPNPSWGLAWPIFAGSHSPPRAVLQSASSSPHNTPRVRKWPWLMGLENQGADSQLVQISIASQEAKELSQFSPNEGLAQRGEETRSSHSMDHWIQRLGIPASWSNSTASVVGNHKQW